MSGSPESAAAAKLKRAPVPEPKRVEHDDVIVLEGAA
jgi:hypothetical protein